MRPSGIVKILTQAVRWKQSYIFFCPYRTKFWRTKFIGGQNFRHQVEIGSFVRRNFFISFLFPPYNSQENMFEHEICIHLTCFRFHWTKFSADKNFRKQIRFSPLLQVMGKCIHVQMKGKYFTFSSPLLVLC